MAYSKAEKREYDRLYKQRPHVKVKQFAYLAEYRKKPEVRARMKDYLWRRAIGNLGVSEEQYHQLLTAQNGLCAICRRPERILDKGGAVRRLSVDHHHGDGKVRGLLCGNCNRGIGLLQEDPAMLRAAADYLEVSVQKADS